jgi:hypothetical protein
MSTKLFFSTALLCALSFSMQAQDLTQRLSQAMQQKRINAYFSGVNPFMEDAIASPDKLMELLQYYEKDSAVSVRNFTYELYAAIHAKTTNNSVKQRIVERLCTALSDSIQRIRATAAIALEDIPKNAFTGKAKQLFIESFTAYGELDEEQVLLAGYLGWQELLGTLQRLKNDPAQENRIRWNCYLALARMGDKIALDFILDATKKQGINDRVVYNYFPDLIYTRRREAFDYLIQELYNTDKNCNSPNPNVSREMVCGYRIMEMLAIVVKDFPLKITASGTIDTKNYDRSLDTARKWFKTHETDYIILDNLF